MAKYKIKDPKAIICIILTSICLSASPMLLTMGGAFFADQNPKVLHYANSMCQVDARSYKQYKCTTRYSQYTCYGPTWDVHHGENRDIFAIVEGKKRYNYLSDALNKAYEYQINSSYSCWYDSRNPAIAQWDKPSIRLAVIFLCSGGLVVLLTILFIFLIVKLIKQERLQNKHDNMDVYCYSNPSMKP